MAHPLTALTGALSPLLAESAARTDTAATVGSGAPFSSTIIIVLCVIAGLATWLVLPSRREIAVRRIGGTILLAAGLIFGALLVRWTIDLGGMGVYFWFFSAIALFASVRVITHTKPVYSALYFVLTVFATAGLFVLMWAEFMAAALVLIYAGAILITYVFVIMLASEAHSGAVGSEAVVNEHDAVSRGAFGASLVGFAVMGLLIFLIADKGQIAGGRVPEANQSRTGLEESNRIRTAPAVANSLRELGSAPELGRELIESHAVNLQIAGVVLTVAMVGAITLARRRVIVSEQDRRSVETLVTPGTPVDDNPHSIPVYGTTNPRHKAYPES
jgi:NADH-quinone oxidoreductase subunit J